MQAVKAHIRWMIRRDMPEVLDTESRSFEYAWTEEDFLHCLRQRNCIGMVAELAAGGSAYEGPVAGYMVYELHKRRLHLLNFAVRPESRRLGVGRSMIDRLTGKLSPDRRNRVTADVRESNLPAQLFFRSCGFEAVKVLRGHYGDSGEDAYRFCRRLRADELQTADSAEIPGW